MSKASVTPRKAIVLAPGQGRAYPMGRISAVFKADNEETQCRYSVSEWWLEPRTQGPGAHSHAEDDLFYVIEGVMNIRVGEDWFECPKGSFVLTPGGVTHDFENRGGVRASVLNFSSPGPFEPDMPSIVEWFAKNAPKDTST
jgi:mannose-6-phosphate isomerase-like protein (cupin superfamily)